MHHRYLRSPEARNVHFDTSMASGKTSPVYMLLYGFMYLRVAVTYTVHGIYSVLALSVPFKYKASAIMVQRSCQPCGSGDPFIS